MSEVIKGKIEGK